MVLLLWCWVVDWLALVRTNGTCCGIASGRTAAAAAAVLPLIIRDKLYVCVCKEMPGQWKSVFEKCIVPNLLGKQNYIDFDDLSLL